MRDMPLFTTENGLVSLILREVPYTGTAYIRIQSSQSLDRLVEDCVGFCRAVGADAVFATGHAGLAKYPFYTEIWQMSCDRAALPDTEAQLIPVTGKTLEDWRLLYNHRMRGVPNAAWLTTDGAREMLAKGDGYFVYHGEKLLGIGRASGNTIGAVISLEPGQGETVLLALNRELSGESIFLEVASSNERALRLYTTLGFTKVRILSSWYQLYKKEMDCQGKILDKTEKV